MNGLPGAHAPVQVYHYHWLAYWKRMAGVALLIVLGAGGTLVWLPLGLGQLTLALIGVLSLRLCWSWHTLAFTPDNRLILQRGVHGSTKDVVSLFGAFTPYQVPVLGRWLNVGSVHLSPIGRQIHLQHIADFESFYRRLVYGVQQQTNRTEQPVQVIVQLPPSQWIGSGWPGQLPAAEAEAASNYIGPAAQREIDGFGGD